LKIKAVNPNEKAVAPPEKPERAAKQRFNFHGEPIAENIPTSDKPTASKPAPQSTNSSTGKQS
jgi:hypothetical protein